MYYFILLNIFPPEIVNIIYKFILIQKSGKIILHNIKSYHLNNRILYNSIDNILKTNLLNHNYPLISDSNILFLDFILKNYYSKKLLNSYFWHNYLNILSKKIMEIHNAINMNIHSNNNIMYPSLKKIITLWFALCVKFNINLKLAIKKNPNNISNSEYDVIYVNSSNIVINKKYTKKIKNFTNFVLTPCVLDDNNYELDIQYSFYILELYKNNYYQKILA